MRWPWGRAILVSIMAFSLGASAAAQTGFSLELESGTTVCLFVPVSPLCPVAGQYATALIGVFAAPVEVRGTLEWSPEGIVNSDVEVFLMVRPAASGEHLVADPATVRSGGSPLAFTWDVVHHAGAELWIVAHPLDRVGPVAWRFGESFHATGVVV